MKLWATRYRRLALEGARTSQITLVWLAAHRDRLRTLLLGGKRLSVLVIWDTKGGQTVDHTDAEVDAMRTVVDGAGRPA